MNCKDNDCSPEAEFIGFLLTERESLWQAFNSSVADSVLQLFRINLRRLNCLIFKAQSSSM